MRDKLVVLLCMASGVAAVGAAASISLAQATQSKESASDVTHTNAAGAEERKAAIEEALDSVTVRELNSVHLAILERMINPQPAKLQLSVRNQGVVTETGPLFMGHEGLFVRKHTFRIKGDMGMPLHWYVTGADRFVIFTMWLSLRKTDESVTSLPGKNRQLYLNVSGETPASLAEPREKLGSRSIRDLIMLLDKDIPAK